jgi:predicted HTH transcriptional regulator
MTTIGDIKKLIAKDETRTLELKKTTGELYKGMETACAFLNSDGGWLMFGDYSDEKEANRNAELLNMVDPFNNYKVKKEA